jgi:hypothetical protein
MFRANHVPETPIVALLGNLMAGCEKLDQDVGRAIEEVTTAGFIPEIKSNREWSRDH